MAKYFWFMSFWDDIQQLEMIFCKNYLLIDRNVWILCNATSCYIKMRAVC
jgi:hypothetical protein